jgi:hypothetical protein
MGISRLNPEQKTVVVELMSIGLGASNIKNELLELYGIDITINGIHKNYVKNAKYQKLADDYRDALSRDLFKIPIANRSARLAILLKAIKLAMKGQDRTEYFKDGKLDRVEYRSVQVVGVSQLIREARAEMEKMENPDHAEKMSLLDIIRDFSKREQRGEVDKGGNGKPIHATPDNGNKLLDDGIPEGSDRLGRTDPKGYTVF